MKPTSKQAIVELKQPGLRPMLLTVRHRLPRWVLAMDDEQGFALAFLVVVCNELKSCDPSYVPAVERLIPAPYRGN